MAPSFRLCLHGLTAIFAPSFTAHAGPIAGLIRTLTEVTVTQTVEVRLVGFDGDAPSKLHVPDNVLLSHLRALRADMDTVVLEPSLAALVCVAPRIQLWMQLGMPEVCA